MLVSAYVRGERGWGESAFCGVGWRDSYDEKRLARVGGSVRGGWEMCPGRCNVARRGVETRPPLRCRYVGPILLRPVLCGGIVWRRMVECGRTRHRGACLPGAGAEVSRRRSDPAHRQREIGWRVRIASSRRAVQACNHEQGRVHLSRAGDEVCRERGPCVV